MIKDPVTHYFMRWATGITVTLLLAYLASEVIIMGGRAVRQLRCEQTATAEECYRKLR